MAEDPLFQRFGREFKKGTVLFREGEAGKDMYVVHQGRVTIAKTAGAVEKILASLGPGEFLGEMSILSGKPRSATATCAEDSKLLVIDAKTYEAMIRGNAEIAVRLIKRLAERLQEADEQIENLLLVDASSRVVHYLARAAQKATKGPAGAKVEISPKELPARVGVKAEAADDVLMKLLKANIISVHPDGFLVPDVDKLLHFLEFLQMKAQFGDVA